MAVEPKMWLQNQNIFDRFIYFPLEVLVRKEPRRFYPVPIVKMSLEAFMVYEISIGLEGIQNTKYKFSNNKWRVDQQENYPPLNSTVILGTKLGGDWMKEGLPISFAMCTVNGKKTMQSIQVETLMLYQPIIYVSQITEDSTGNIIVLKQKTFVFNCLRFMAVTGFKNPDFIKLKHELCEEKSFYQQMKDSKDTERNPLTTLSGSNNSEVSSEAGSLLNGTENWIEGIKSFDILAVGIDDEELNKWIYTYQTHTHNVYHPTLKFALLEE